MCGIAGTVNCGDLETLRRMTDIQAHRGPDDRGVWEYQAPDGTRVGLGSRRLAILDLSPAGHMPMSTPDGSLTITYNGEIYNHLELREELATKGYCFRSHSDTETILYMYQEEGPDCVRRLNGIFALGIWDMTRQQLFLARDHFGIKPLYYYYAAPGLLFASEIKALLQHPDVPHRLNLTALHQYMTLLWTPDPLTMFEGIYKLPAGHYATFRDGQFTITQYWELSLPSHDHVFEADEKALAQELRARFLRIVKGQMLSDVPLGAFLSAGLDSSSILAAMAQASSDPVRTFTVTFPANYRRGEVTIDDPEVARRTAAHYGCRHTEIVVEPNVVELLPKLIWHMDEPIADPAIITAYLVNREARKDVTVLLSGIGGDELFAGYRKYRADALARRYRQIPQVLRQGVIEPLVQSLPSFQGTRFHDYVRLAKKMARSGSLPPKERFLMDSVYLTDEHKARIYVDEVYDRIGPADPFVQHRQCFEHVTHADPLNQMLFLDIKTFMVSLNLTYNDKMSMASSVEVRVPFLDWQLAEWVAWHVPPALKLHGGTTKHILREAMRPLLPPEVLTQKKAGFGAPVARWVTNDLRDMLRQLLNEDTLKRRGLFKPQAVHRLISEHMSGRADWSLQIWQFLTLELWMQAFID